MSIITASRLNTLKSAVKAECNRRKYTGSVTTYAGSTYNYNKTPAKNVIIEKEIYEKNAVPLNAISGDISTEVSSNIIKDSDFLKLETKVASLKKISLSAAAGATGCNASCTGLCSTGCGDSCSGCTGCGSGCASTCKGDCEGSCSGGCSGSCTGCEAECRDDCTANCADDCWARCADNCRGDCEGDCSDACSKDCGSGCSGGCSTSCDKDCSDTCANTNNYSGGKF